MLFSGPSIWTMIHGVGLGGLALMALAAALYYVWTVPADGSGGNPLTERQARAFAQLTALTAVVLWATVIIGTYIIFPPYRATPPEGITDLSAYPRALIHSNPDTVWLHAFGMEIKEHVPWIAAMLASAVAFVSMRYKAAVFASRDLRSLVNTTLWVCFVLVSFVGVLGVFINKVAPLD
jgi:hypothetical protein